MADREGEGSAGLGQPARRDPGPGAGGRLVGTMVAGWDGWRGNLYRLAVLPLRLVAEAERRLAEKGAIRPSALVMSGHDPAVACGSPPATPTTPGRPLRPILRPGAGP